MNTALSLLMLAAIIMLGGAFVLWRRGGASRQVTLMVVLAVVMIVNVLIWTLPDPGRDPGGVAPVEVAAKLGN